MTRSCRNRMLALALLLAGAFVRLPAEQHLTTELREKQLLPEKLDATLREQMSQESFAAAFGGLRSLLASFYELEAFSGFAREPPRWDVVDHYYALCTQLQPRDGHYWEMHSWMLSSNAAEDLAEKSVHGLDQARRQDYRRRGLEIAERGMKFNPDDYRIYERAAWILAWPSRDINPNPDYGKAAEYFLKASQCPHAPRYLYRNYVFSVSNLPERKEQAYRLLKQLYDQGPSERFPTVITRLKFLENVLNIPAASRIPEPDPAPPPPKP